MKREDWTGRFGLSFNSRKKKTAFPSRDVERRHKKGMYYEAKLVIILE